MADTKRASGVNRAKSAAPRGRFFTARRIWMVAIPLLTVGVLAAVTAFLFVRSGDEPESTGRAFSSAGGPIGSAQAFQPFTLMNQFGKRVTITPGDGKNYLLVFYMGYF